MDNKTATCVTGFVVCAMLYANVSATRAAMRDSAGGTFILAGASARPAVSISSPWQSTPGTGREPPRECRY